MKRNFYLQHPLMAMHDPRMKHLKEKEGLKGIGAYWFIIEKLALLPQQCAQPEYLQPFCDRDIRLSYLRKIINEYQLFSIDPEGYFMPEELNPARKKSEKTTENLRNTPNTLPENDGKQPENSKKQAENDKKQPENDEKTAKSELINLKPKSEKSAKTVIQSKLPNNTPITDKENIKDITTAATEKEKEKTADADDNFPSSSSVAVTTPLPPPDITARNGWGELRRPLHPVRPWQELVDRMPRNRLWMEMACMRSGYATLLMRHLSEAIEYFKQHITLYCKGDRLLTEEDSCSYFVNFVNVGGRTSQALKNHLLEIESQEKAALNAASPDPYRYEQTVNGKRTYLGCPIPDDAPPRPDENAVWNEELHTWMPGRKPKKNTR